MGRSAANKKYWASPKGQAAAKRYQELNKERIAKTARKHDLKEFGISLEDYDAMFAKQNGECAICGQHSNQNLCVDHDHKTGKIRGLLCRRCNAGLGLFKDNVELVLEAFTYLSKE